MSSRHRLSVLLSTAIAAVSLMALVVALLTAPAHAARSSYVALGDSYSSGTGTRSYIDDGTSCQRSVHAFPSLIASAQRYELNFRACSGARVADVTNLQLGALSSSTDFVTLSVGGNDAGFADVLTECATPWWAGDCDGAIDTAQAFIRNTLPGRLSTLYAAVRTRAPNATVVIVGYPRIFMGEDCNAGTWFSPSEQTRLNATADLLNQKTREQATARGFGFANPTSRFIGHAVCDDVEWINGLSSPIAESYHPNRAGHRDGYTPSVSPALTGTTVKVTGKTRKSAVASADELAASQEQYAVADSAIEPERVTAPDLTSRQSRRDARAAGVDLDRWLARHAN